MADKYTNIPAPDSVVIESRVGNITKTTGTADRSIFLGLTRTNFFIPQGARVQSYVSNNYILSENTTSTLYYIFNNYGDSGNKIEYAEAGFSGGGITIQQAFSGTSGLWNVAGLTFSKNNLNLDGGQRDVVRLIINDTIVSGQVRDLIPSVTVNTSFYVSTELPVGKTNRIFFQTSPPTAKGKITPGIMFANSNKATNIFVYSIYNDGDGSNELEQAVIYIPDILANKVTGSWSTWLGGAGYITNKPDRIIISYNAAGNTLNTKATDNITLAVTNNLIARTNLFWLFAAANNNGAPPATNNMGTISNGSKYVSVVEQPYAYINSGVNIYDSLRTNSFEYKFVNPASGMDIIKARIYIPPVYTIAVSTLASSNKSGTVSFSIASNYIEIDYTADTLKPAENDVISFDIIDSINKTTNISKWQSEIQYFADDIFYPTSEDTGSQYLKIILAPADAVITVSPEILYTTSVTNTVIVIVSNKGQGDNYITRLRIDYPDMDWNILSVDSLIITNSANEVEAGGYLYFRYDWENKNIPAGTNDIITVQFTDSIISVCSRTLYAGANNEDPGAEDYSTSAGDANINYVLPADAHILPDNIDSTTYTNVYTYKINNQAGSSAVKQAVIKLPAIITNIISANSSYMFNNANIKWDNTVSTITLNYYNDINGDLPTSTNDTITLELADAVSSGWTNGTFESLVNDGTGYVQTVTTISQSKIVEYYMPDASASAYIEPVQISTVSASNLFTYVITNKGSGTDKILQARILIPFGFTKITNIQSSIISNDSQYAFSPVDGNYIMLDYNGDSNNIPPGASDTITFLAFDNITGDNYYTWPSEVYNYAPNWIATGLYTSKTQTVHAVSPGYSAMAGVEPNQIESTVITNHIFTVRITNVGQTGHDIIRSEIFIPLPAFTTNNISVESTAISTSNEKRVTPPTINQPTDNTGIIFETPHTIL